MSERETLQLFHLPNEILVSTLSLLTTAELLPLTVVSQRFHYLAIRVIHFRLLLAASNPLYKIILEAYLPSRRDYHPYLHCTYLGTDGLSSSIEGEGSMYADCKDQNGKEIVGGRLAKLGGLYSRFRPEHPGVKGQMPVRRIAGAAPDLQSNNTSGLQTQWHNAPGQTNMSVPASSTSAPSEVSSLHQNAEGGGAQTNTTLQGTLPQTQPIWSNFGDGGAKKITYEFHFDEDELFGQFCLAAALVRPGPRRGVFTSYLQICSDRQGVMRVWREWLVERSREIVLQSACTGGWSGNALKRNPTVLKPEDIIKDPSILWTDHRKNTGLRMIVREKEVGGVSMRDPDTNKDSVPMLFDVEIEEFIIRTSQLMLGIEDLQEAQTRPGNALIFGNFAVAMQ